VDDTLIQLRVKQITFEAERINSYTLHAVGDGELPAFTAGAHIDLHLGNGMVRSYSLLNDSRERHRYVVGIKHDAASRGGSTFVHTALKAGDVVRATAPRNNFTFDEGNHPSVFIAGGIGITPILSMLRRAVALQRPWQLHYASRTRCDAPFLEDIARLAHDGQGHSNILFDHEPGGAPLDLGAITAGAPPEAHLYCCGPLPMLTAFETAVANRARPTVHVEYFSPKAAAATDGGFEVRLEKSGRTITVQAGQSILNALLDAGIAVSYACGEGTCGTCETKVLDGIPDHRDVYLDDAEHAANKQVMICCSGSKTPLLVLDI